MGVWYPWSKVTLNTWMWHDGWLTPEKKKVTFIAWIIGVNPIKVIYSFYFLLVWYSLYLSLFRSSSISLSLSLFLPLSLHFLLVCLLHTQSCSLESIEKVLNECQKCFLWIPYCMVTYCVNLRSDNWYQSGLYWSFPYQIGDRTLVSG